MSSIPDSTETIDQEPFTTPGIADDEIELQFQDDDRKLYVSKGFMSYISPVFRAMFSSRSDFTEKRENKIVMKKKKYDDLLQFLRHFHPQIKAPITALNVYTIVPLVQEYMNEDSLKKCKEVLKTMVEGYKDGGYKDGADEAIRNTLRVLHLAIEHDFSDIRDFTLETLVIWNKKDSNRRLSFRRASSKTEIQSLYQTLPSSVKIELMERRLRKVNDELFDRLL